MIDTAEKVLTAVAVIFAMWAFASVINVALPQPDFLIASVLLVVIVAVAPNWVLGENRR